eukprot:3066527-Amphidinium_carterae.1
MEFYLFSLFVTLGGCMGHQSLEGSLFMTEGNYKLFNAGKECSTCKASLDGTRSTEMGPEDGISKSHSTSPPRPAISQAELPKWMRTALRLICGTYDSLFQRLLWS